MEPLTQEQQDDVSARVAEFRKRYLANVEELMVDFLSFPQYNQLQDGSYTTICTVNLIDKRYAPVKSPFVTEG